MVNLIIVLLDSKLHHLDTKEFISKFSFHQRKVTLQYAYKVILIACKQCLVSNIFPNILSALAELGAECDWCVTGGGAPEPGIM